MTRLGMVPKRINLAQLPEKYRQQIVTVFLRSQAATLMKVELKDINMALEWAQGPTGGKAHGTYRKAFANVLTNVVRTDSRFRDHVIVKIQNLRAEEDDNGDHYEEQERRHGKRKKKAHKKPARASG